MSQANVIAKVWSLKGSAFARSPSGKIRQLKVGDVIREEESIVTAQGLQAVIKMNDGREIALKSSETLRLDSEVVGTATPGDSALTPTPATFKKVTDLLASGKSLDALLEEEAPAAGPAGSGSEGGHSFIEFLRVVENVGGATPAYQFSALDRNLPTRSSEDALLRAPDDKTPPNGGEAPTVNIDEDKNNDGFINHTEAQGDVDVTVSFSKTAIEVGDKVSITDGSVTREVIVTAEDKANGYVTTQFPPHEHGSTMTITAVITDPAGNSTPKGEDSAKLDLSDFNDPTKQQLTVEITEDTNNDGFINKSELDGKVNISITLPAAAIAGDLLTINITGNATQTHLLTQADIDAKHFNLEIDPPANGNKVVVSAKLTDTAGNHSTNPEDPTGKDWFVHDAATIATGNAGAPTVTITEDAYPVGGDGFINRNELQGDVDVQVGFANLQVNVGDRVRVTDGTSTREIIISAADKANGYVTTQFPPPAQGSAITMSATITDPYGNTSEPGSDSAIIDTTVFTGLAIQITEDANNDGYISKAELKDNDIDVRVTLPQGAAIGDSLTVTGSGNIDQVITLTAEDLAKGYVDVKFNPTADNTDFVTTASISDKAGNHAGDDPFKEPVQDSADIQLSAPGKPEVQILQDQNNDGVINAAEIKDNIDVSITLPGTAQVGDKLSVTVNGVKQPEITLTLEDINRGSIAVNDILNPGEGKTVEVTAKLTDPAGNTGEAGSDSAKIDTSAPNGGKAPDVTISEDENNDGFINRKEAKLEVDVKVAFNKDAVDVGDKVSITDGTITREVIVSATDKANGYVTTQFLPHEHGSTMTVTAVITDPAGNSTPKGEDSAKVDLSDFKQQLTVQITEDTNNDGFINNSELDGKVNVSIALPAGAIAGDSLTIYISGNATQTHTLTHADIDAKHFDFEIDPPANGTKLEVTAQVHDAAGNQSDIAADSATIATNNPCAPVVVITEDENKDGYINAEELNGDIGVRIDLPKEALAGECLRVIVNGEPLPPILLTQADINRGSVSIPGIANPGEGKTIEVSASITDMFGNTGPDGSSSAIIDTTTFKGIAVQIREDANDDGYISQAELKDNDIDVRVTLPQGAAIGDSLTVSGSGNTNQVITLNADHLAKGYVEVKFNPTADNTDFVTTASISDKAGNHAGDDPLKDPVQDSARIQLSAPGKPEVQIFQDLNNDGFINAAEIKDNIDVSITLPGTAEVGDKLIVTVNGVKQPEITLTLEDINRGSIAVNDIPNPDEGKTIEVTAQLTDPAGNAGETGSDKATVDTSSPVQPGSPVTITISEEDLSGGSTKAQDTIVFQDSSKLHLQLVALNGSFPELTSDGQPIVWTLSPDGQMLLGHIGSPTGTEAIRVKINDQGEVRTTLSAPIDHPTAGKDDKDLQIGVQATDEAGNVSEKAVFNIKVEDDTPTATPNSHNNGEIYFAPSGSNTTANHNVPPDVHAFSSSLLGLVGVDALNLIDLSGDQYQASDANNNISKIVIESGALLSINLGGDEVLTWSKELADALGLKVELVYDAGLLGLGSHFTLTITAKDGSVIENLSIKELLSTLRADDALLNLNVLDNATITATDTYGACDTASIGTLVDLSLLNSTEATNVQVGTANNDTLTGNDKSNILLGGDGNDTLNGQACCDVLHGDAGNDQLDGGTGNDLLIGGAGNDILIGGAGNDVFSWNLADRGTPGNPAIDTIKDFGNGWDVLRITNLLNGNGTDPSQPHKLSDYVWIEKAANGDAIIHISSTGGFATGHDTTKEDQRIILEGYGSRLTGDSNTDLRNMLDNQQLIIGNDTASSGSLGSFGADGGHVQKVTVGGDSYCYDPDTNTIQSENPFSCNCHSYDSTSHQLTVVTAAGETIIINMENGSYSYTASKPLPQGQETTVEYTLIDNDGDTASGTLHFNGTVEPIPEPPPPPPPVAPETGIATGGNLLGIIGLDALDLIDLGTRTRFSAFDANNNLSKVEISYDSLINLGAHQLHASMALANELGLNLVIHNDPGFLGLILPHSSITITAKDGGTIDNLAINELLASVHYEQSLLDATVLSATTITATDSTGFTSTTNIGSLAEVGLLSSPDQNHHLVEGSANEQTLSATVDSSRLYGYGGDDTLIGSQGSDLLRGGEGKDSLHGGDGNDLLIGGKGDDTLFGGSGSDVFRWEFGDQGSVQIPAIDHIKDFNARASVGNGGDVLDLRDLLQGEYHDGNSIGNLEQYLRFESTASGTSIHINPQGNSAAPTQTIVLDNVDLTANGQFTNDSMIIKNLLEQGKLLVD